MKIRRFFLLALCAVMIFTSSVIPTASIAKADESAISYDYSNTSSGRNHTVSAADFIRSLGYDVSEAEEEYLNTYCDFKLRYDLVSQDKIEKRVTGADGELKKIEVEAQLYQYTAVDGATLITWVPVKAEIVNGDGGVLYSETTYTKDGAKYTFTFDSVDLDISYDYRVQYQITDGITIVAKDVNFLLDYVYNEVTEVEPHLEFYNESKENENAIKAYYEYLHQKSVWDQKTAYVSAYPSLSQKYQEDLKAYESYLKAYQEYLGVVEEDNKLINNYNQEMKLYNEYLAVLDTMKAQIETFDTALTKKMTYLDREIYGCFFAPLVDEVVANKDKLIAAFGEKVAGPIDDSKRATENIRLIFRPTDGDHYDNLETVDDKYSFYRMNYKALCDNIYLLTNSLYKIYTTTGMVQLFHLASETLGREDYTERLAIFIAQLTGLCGILFDEPVTYTDGQGNTRTASEITFNYRTKAGVDVKNRTINDIFEGKEFVVDNNNATPITTPENPGEPIYPTLKAPAKPEEVIRPNEPEKPTDPGPEPTKVDKPAGMPEGGFDWEKFISNALYRELLQTLLHEKVDRPDSDDVQYIPTYSLAKPFNDDAYVRINFYGDDKKLIESVEVKKGSDVLAGLIPEKTEDVCATYDFVGWKSADGEQIYTATKDLDLYPIFEPNYKNDYTVKDNYLTALTTNNLVRLPIARFAEMVASDGHDGLKVIAKDIGLKIDSDTLSKLIYSRVDYLVAEIDNSSFANPTCIILAYTDDGEMVDVSSELTVYFAMADSGFDVTCKNSAGDDKKTNKEMVKFSDEESATFVYFNVALNDQHSLSVKYTVSKSSSISAPKLAAPGEVVNVNVNSLRGMKAEVYYMLNGQRYSVEGNSFVMPNGSIELFVDYTDEIYTVTFLVDGEVYKQYYYKYNDILDKIPPAPTKVNDHMYSYKFKKWNPVLETHVTENLVYRAIFEPTPLPQEVHKINWLRVLVVAFLVALVLGFVSLILLILHKTKVINVKKIIPAIIGLFKKKDKKVAEDAVTVEESENAEKTAENVTSEENNTEE